MPVVREVAGGVESVSDGGWYSLELGVRVAPAKLAIAPDDAADVGREAIDSVGAWVRVRAVAGRLGARLGARLDARLGEHDGCVESNPNER